MSRWKLPGLEDRIQHGIHIGGVYASAKPSVVRTVLGSCISVCLRDPVLCVGGMNHFMLPDGDSSEEASSRYGVHAMELLINACMKAGADRRRLEAKVFGGGHVLRIRETEDNVPKANMRFALKFLALESIPICSQDIGGYEAREVYFWTDSGKTLLRRIQPSDVKESATLASLRRQEKSAPSTKLAPAMPDDDSNITLF